MKVTLDGQTLFDEQQLEIEVGSISRDSIEKSAAGVDGVFSVDLGSRKREIKQNGVLRAKSKTELDARIGTISAYMDGNVHTLITGSGNTYANLRMDVFKVSKERISGANVCCDYKIIYTQLKV